jgi:hypothetical protein
VDEWLDVGCVGHAPIVGTPPGAVKDGTALPDLLATPDDVRPTAK